mmetsp:Transcript_18083/g.32852  ORF Transcript_18083/g.32852 Transcript_18083/m.32852 type:complete len:201 (-) Transcript_18083:474-1076(-)
MPLPTFTHDEMAALKLNRSATSHSPCHACRDGCARAAQICHITIVPLCKVSKDVLKGFLYFDTALIPLDVDEVPLLSAKVRLLSASVICVNRISASYLRVDIILPQLLLRYVQSDSIRCCYHVRKVRFLDPVGIVFNPTPTSDQGQLEGKLLRPAHLLDVRQITTLLAPRANDISMICKMSGCSLILITNWIPCIKLWRG